MIGDVVWYQAAGAVWAAIIVRVVAGTTVDLFLLPPDQPQYRARNIAQGSAQGQWRVKGT